MAKYIDREDLIEWLKRIPLIDLSDGRGLCRVIMEDDFKKAIKKMPKGIIADVEPVRHGRWEKNVRGDYSIVCSECGYGFPTDGYAWLECNRRSDEREYCFQITDVKNYCPNCGARMDGEVDHAKE